MRKKILIFTTLIISVLILGIKNSSFGAELPTEPPTIGVEDPSTDFSSRWDPQLFGSKRLDNTTLALAMTSGFGYRAGFRTHFDATDFEMSLDLTYMDKGTTLVGFFGTELGNYINNNGAVLIFDFVKHPTKDGEYLVTFNKGTGFHAESFPGFVPSGQSAWWDPAFKGYILNVPDHKIHFQIKEVDDLVEISINGEKRTLSSDLVYAEFDDKHDANLSFGFLDKDNSVQTVIVKDLFDGERREYYKEGGVFDTFESDLVELESLILGDLSVLENLIEVSDLKEGLDFDSLYSFDKHYLSDRYNHVVETVDNAITDYGGAMLVISLSKKVDQYEAAISNITDDETARNAVSIRNSLSNELESTDTTNFDPEELSDFADLETRFDNLNEALIDKVFDLIEDLTIRFETLANDLSDYNDLNEMLKLYEEATPYLLNLLDEDDREDFNDRLDAALALVDDSLFESDDWRIGDNTYPLEVNGKIQATFIGESMGEKGNGIFYTKERFDVRNFEMNIDINQITNHSGGWFSFGLMENPEIFINAEDSSVQDNKGIFFLFYPQTQGRIKILIYQMSLYSNRFFDAELTETLMINIRENLNIKFSTITKEIAGIEANYISINIGGAKLETITTNSMRTSLIDYQGYLYLAGSGGNTKSPTTVTVNSINTHKPTEDDLSMPEEKEPIEFNIEDQTYLKGSETDLVIPFDESLTDFTLKFGSVLVPSDAYELVGNNIVISHEYLETLADNDYDFIIDYIENEASFKLTITSEETPDKPIKDNNSLVVWLISGSALVLLLGGVLAFIIIKRKRV